jgi:hypothetical protein
MADTRRTKIGLLRALRLCGFGVIAPQKLVDAERADEEIRKQFSQPPPREATAFKLKRAFWTSLFFVLCSIAIGYFSGKMLGAVIGPGAARLVASLQIVGGMLLLWATLFVRGWDIQSFGGVTLTERVNQWIYRSLYCLGTAIVVASLALAEMN